MPGFMDTLMHYRKGAVVAAADEELAEVIRACLATGKPGALTLKLVITPEKHGNQLSLTANVDGKAPRADLPKAMFFGDLDGGLHRTDPDQREMFGDASDGAPRKVSDLARVDRPAHAG